MIELKSIINQGIIGIIRENSYEKARNTARVMVDSGLNNLEFTTTTPRVFELVQEYSENISINVGVGTVLNTEQLKMSVASGAKFSISPNTDVDIIKNAKEMNFLHIPGVFSPSDIAVCVKYESRFLKLFPASFFQPNILQAFNQPFPNITWLVTGGINLNNVGTWIKSGAQSFGIGSFILDGDKDLIFKKVTSLLQLIQEERVKSNENN